MFANKSNRIWLAVVLICAAFFETQIVDGFNSVKDRFVTPASNVDFVEPAQDVQDLVSGVADTVVGETAAVDKKEIRDFFFHLSNVVKNEPGFIKTTGDFREFNSMAGQINFAGQSLKDKYSNLGERIDQILIRAIGQENVPMDSTMRSNLSEVLYGIAWEFSK